MQKNENVSSFRIIAQGDTNNDNFIYLQYKKIRVLQIHYLKKELHAKFV